MKQQFNTATAKNMAAEMATIFFNYLTPIWRTSIFMQPRFNFVFVYVLVIVFLVVLFIFIFSLGFYNYLKLHFMAQEMIQSSHQQSTGTNPEDIFETSIRLCVCVCQSNLNFVFVCLFVCFLTIKHFFFKFKVTSEKGYVLKNEKLNKFCHIKISLKCHRQF